jgi:hypothetical protein
MEKLLGAHRTRASSHTLYLAELQWILKESDYAAEPLQDKNFCRTLDPKGFWRVDRDKDPELRHTVLSLVAFKALKQPSGKLVTIGKLQ